MALSVSGWSAQVPFTELEAEDAVTDGTILVASRTYGTLAAEASGRSAVTLTAGQQLTFILTSQAHAVDIRCSVLDNAAGTGTATSLALTSGGESVGVVKLTSKYSWF